MLVALARALGVKAADLMREPAYTFEVVAYRALASLPKRERSEIECRVQVELERRLTLMDRLGIVPKDPFDELSLKVQDVAQAEEAAEELRCAWNLGGAPIASVADTLEEEGVFLIEVDTTRKFDGVAIRARNDEGDVVACGIATRQELTRSRQRMDHAHELGHLAVDVGEDVDAETAARRFAGAFLFPREAVIAEFGSKRNRITNDELLLAKARWGLSMQGILYRLKDLDVLNETSYRWWCMRINQAGWREREPGDESPETSTWVALHARRAAAEGLIAQETLADYLPRVETERFPGDLDRRELMRLPLEERRALLQAQAEACAEQYNRGIDDEWLTGDFEDE